MNLYQQINLHSSHMLLRSAVTIQSLQNGILKRQTLLAYFYCDFRHPQSQDPLHVIGSLVAQLCLQINAFPSSIEEQYNTDSQRTGALRRPEFSLLEEACREISELHQIRFVIDALDECESRKEILDFLFFTAGKSTNLSIMVTSRDEKDIRCRFAKLPRICLESESQSLAKDILLYIKIRLDTESELKWLNQQIRGEIEEQLSSSKNGSWM
jgi:hypothetical protein